MVPNLNNLKEENNHFFTSKTSRIGRFIFEDDKYTTIMMDLIKGTYERNDWYLNVFS